MCSGSAAAAVPASSLAPEEAAWPREDKGSSLALLVDLEEAASALAEDSDKDSSLVLLVDLEEAASALAEDLDKDSSLALLGALDTPSSPAAPVMAGSYPRLEADLDTFSSLAAEATSALALPGVEAVDSSLADKGTGSAVRAAPVAVLPALIPVQTRTLL